MPIFSKISRSLFADGESFGTAGQFELIRGELAFRVDPLHSRNARIVDLDQVQRDACGLVGFTSSLVVIRPLDPDAGNGCVLVDIPNRGRVLSLNQFNRAGREELNPEVLQAGDGFLFEKGYTLASIGWQWDLKPGQGLIHGAPRLDTSVQGEVICQFKASKPTTTMPLGQLGDLTYPPLADRDMDARLYRRVHGSMQLLDRAQWQFARASNAGFTPSRGHVYCEQGFEPGVTYQIVYLANKPAVAGTGLLAVREFVSSVRREGNATGRTFDTVLGFGASQTGRFLRHFVYEGMNTDVDGNKVFDGVIAHIAGGQRGDFNHRFAQPSSAGAASYGQQFPFAATSLEDPVSKIRDGLVAHDNTPLMLLTNTSWEYWRGDASLVHIDGVNNCDIDEHPDTRAYLFSGAQHINGSLPQTDQYPLLGVHARNGFCVLDCSVLLRAALINLHRWVGGVAPPRSMHPRLDDGTAITREAALEAYKNLPLLGTLDPLRLGRTRQVDPGDQPNRQLNHYPAETVFEYPVFVSAVDEDFNEVAGVRLPDLVQPVGTHTGWNPWHADTKVHGEPTIFFGSTLWFAAGTTQRREDDPRRVINARYRDRDAYEQVVREAAAKLCDQRYLLTEDLSLVVAGCLARFDAACAN